MNKLKIITCTSEKDLMNNFNSFSLDVNIVSTEFKVSLKGYPFLYLAFIVYTEK